MDHRVVASSAVAVAPGVVQEPKPVRASAVADNGLWSKLFGAPPLLPAERHALDDIKKTRALATGQAVFSHQAIAGSLVALLEGEVALGFRTVDGTFRTERIVRGLAWLDLSSAWLEDRHAMDARAMTPATVVELPRVELALAVQQHPGLAMRLIQGLANEVHALAANTHELMHKDAPARLAQWLRQRCLPVPGRDGEGVVQLHERKRDVASQLAITPETLSRLMRSFTRLGVLEVAGYTVRVLDTDMLAQMAQA
jgi:CRP-like cAMP-binding protein